MKKLMTRAEYESREENIFFIGVSYENYVINEFGNTVPEQFMTIKTKFENACKYLGINENGNRISAPCTWKTKIFENFIDAENFANSKEFAVHSINNRCCVYYIAKSEKCLKESNAENFQELRKRTEMNQKEFAKKYGIPYRTYQRWEEEGAEQYKYTLLRAAVEYKFYLNCIDQKKDGKFYIIRNEYHTENFLYGICYTLADTIQAIHNDIEKGIELNDVAIEFCKGTDIFNYDVTKTMFYHGRNKN